MSDKNMKKEDSDFSSEYITFVVHTAKYRTLPTRKYLARKQWVPVDANKVFSKIPGLIYKIYVKEGAKLAKGDIVIELEAMKMLNRILCPFNAIIKKIHVSEKERVGKHVLLFELTPIKKK